MKGFFSHQIDQILSNHHLFFHPIVPNYHPFYRTRRAVVRNQTCFPFGQRCKRWNDQGWLILHLVATNVNDHRKFNKVGLMIVSGWPQILKDSSFGEPTQLMWETWKLQMLLPTFHGPNFPPVHLNWPLGNTKWTILGDWDQSRLEIPLELLVLNLANSNPKWCSISGLAIEGVHLREMRCPGKATLVFSPRPPTCQRSMCAIGVNDGLVVDSSFCVSYLKQCDIDPMIGETLCMCCTGLCHCQRHVWSMSLKFVGVSG